MKVTGQHFQRGRRRYRGLKQVVDELIAAAQDGGALVADGFHHRGGQQATDARGQQPGGFRPERVLLVQAGFDPEQFHLAGHRAGEQRLQFRVRFGLLREGGPHRPTRRPLSSETSG